MEKTLERYQALTNLNRAMEALTTIDTSKWSDGQKLLLADVLWPLGELVDTVLETQK
jgi:hypothetical protein